MDQNKEKAPCKTKPTVPAFGDLLIEDFATGKSSGVRSQQTAQSAVEWCKQVGGTVTKNDTVGRIASLGSSGQYSSNTERDFHTLIKSYCKRLGAKIDSVPVRMFNHMEAKVEYQQMAILFPDSLADALFRAGEKVFQKTLFADVNAADFWEHVKNHCPWYEGHPAQSYPLKSHLVPFSLYGDDISTYRNSDVGNITVLGWTSDFTWGNSAFLRYFPICVYSEHNAIPDITMPDIMSHLVPRLREMFDSSMLHTWSSSGYHFCMSSIQGDLKWIAEMFHLHNYRANQFCSLCGCCKNHDDISMTLGDFRENASHLTSAPDLSDFYANRSQIFDVPGASIARVLHDVAHSQLLGTGKVANGSALVYLCERGYFGAFGRGRYPLALELHLREVHRTFLTWKKTNKLACSQPRFTVARLKRGHRMAYPLLQSKAVAAKILTYWLTECMNDLANSAGATDYDRTAAICMQSYSSMLRLMDTGGVVFSEEIANEFYDQTMLHLRSYAALNRLSRTLQGKTAGRSMWVLKPKHHHMEHLARQVRVEMINPAFFTLLTAEDFVGRVGRIARSCHRNTVSLRTLQRYLATLYMTIQKNL